MRTKVTWFRHDHEHRNDWLRFGFMRLHKKGLVEFRQLPWSHRVDFGFEEKSTETPLKANSLFAVETDTQKRTCVAESNDSFYVMSDFIRYADCYFCAGFNSEFFVEKSVPAPLIWQSEPEFEAYRKQGTDLIRSLGDHFEKAKAFIPIAPNLGRHSRLPSWKQRLRNASHKLSKTLGPEIPWSGQLSDFDDREKYLKSLRGLSPNYDVVLLDTLWGWPNHRIRLHERLKTLSESGFDIHSRLKWHSPSEWDGSASASIDASRFPMEIGTPIENYELSLAQSRLAVFATGFHFGWRNIMTLCLMIGIPVLHDRIILEPWFGMDKFDIAYNDSATWDCLTEKLNYYDAKQRQETLAKNIASFDKHMSPEATASYVLKGIFK